MPIGKKMPVVHSSASAFSTDGRVHRPRAVVEGQHHFLVAQEVELLEMLEAEAGAAGGVDLDGAADAERVRIVAGGSGGLRSGRGGWSRGGRCGAAAGGAAAPLAGGVCDHAALDASSETAPAKINPAAIRILFSLKSDPAPGTGFCRRPGRFRPNA